MLTETGGQQLEAQQQHNAQYNTIAVHCTCPSLETVAFPFKLEARVSNIMKPTCMQHYIQHVYTTMYMYVYVHACNICLLYTSDAADE